MAAFVDNEGARTRRKDLEGLQEFDEAVAVVGRERVEGLPCGKRLSAVGFDGFPGGSKSAMMHG